MSYVQLHINYVEQACADHLAAANAFKEVRRERAIREALEQSRRGFAGWLRRVGWLSPRVEVEVSASYRHPDFDDILGYMASLEGFRSRRASGILRACQLAKSWGDEIVLISPEDAEILSKR